MNTAEIRAALAAATPGPWDEGSSEATMNNRSAYRFGPRSAPAVFLAYQMRREDAHLIANAPTWLAELLAEVDRLTSAVHMYADKLAEHECEAAAVAELGVALEETSNNAADYFDRALAAEQAVERVRDYAAYLNTLAGGDRHYAIGILRALDGDDLKGGSR